MRWKLSRASDNTFDLNLAPVLDIIVSVVPMLLLSIAFLDVKMIETPVPQVVQKAIDNLEKKETTEITLALSKTKGFVFTVTDQGRKAKEVVVAMMKDGNMDLTGLHTTAVNLKQDYPTVFNLSVAPDKDVPLKDIISALDQVRRSGMDGKKVQVKDPESGQLITTDLMFPKVVFANVVGE